MTDKSKPRIRVNRAVLNREQRHALEWIERRLPENKTTDEISKLG